MRLLFFAVSTALLCQAQGEIYGSVLDPTGGPLSSAEVRIARVAAQEVIHDGNSGATGLFRSGPLAPGVYRVRAWVAGFRTQFVENVSVSDGNITRLDPIILRLQGCDSPFLNCHGIPKRGAANNIVLRRDCSIDFEKPGAVSCLPADASSRYDLRFEGRNNQIFFTALHGACFSKINPENLDCEAASHDRRETAVDTMGPGFDLCVCSGKGGSFRIYFMSAMKPTSAEIEFRLVRLTDVATGKGLRCKAVR